jgi:hypothetical protein
MTGTWYLWDLFLGSPWFSTYTKDFNLWWVNSTQEKDPYDALASAVLIGRTWNENLWSRSEFLTFDWAYLAANAGTWKGNFGNPLTFPGVGTPTHTIVQ